MFDINSIKAAKSKASQNYEKINKDLEEEFSKGMAYFGEFARTHSVHTLRKAMDKFFFYIENKRTRPEPFFYIAFSAYLLNERVIAEKYLNFTKQVAPDFQYINQLKALINKI